MTKAKDDISPDVLREIFEYRDTHLYWRRRRQGTRDINKPAGCIENSGYRRIHLNKKMYKAHRLIWAHQHGYYPDGHIDHIDGNRSNNAIDNLRLATHSENLCNRGKTSNNSSGYKGVYKCRRSGKWIGKIMKDYKEHHLGRFDTAEKAHQAYEDAASKLHGQFHHYPRS